MTDQHQQPPEQPAAPDKPKKSIRQQRREARMKMVRDAREPRKVRVTPSDENRRGRLVHPRKGGFRSTGSVEWPLDTFTKRRIRDGDVTVEQREQNQPEGEHVAAEPRRGARTGGSGQHVNTKTESFPPSGQTPVS